MHNPRRKLRQVQVIVALSCVVGTAACIDKREPTGPRADAPFVTLRAQFQTQPTLGADALDVVAGYRLASGSTVVLATQRVPVANVTRQIGIPIDLSACLADADRTGITNACPLVVSVRALDAGGAVLDSMQAGPYRVADSGRAPLDVTMDFGTVTFLAWGDTVRLTQAQIPANATTSEATFSSSDSSVANVSSNGLVTANVIGTAVVSASHGSVTIASRIHVTPRAAESLAAGDYFNCALTYRGSAYCWGADTVGQLGDNGLAGRNGPTPVAGSHVFRQIAAGGSSACALTTEGDVYCWGLGEHGQLGNGTSGPGALSPVPIRVSGTTKYQSVAVGYRFACGVSTSGLASCWGYSSRPYGIPDTVYAIQTTVPTPVPGANVFRTVEAGLMSACGLTVQGATLCWGDNDVRTMGTGPGVPGSLAPIPVIGGLNLVMLSHGMAVVCATDASSMAYCWGTGFNGALGTGAPTTTFALAPSPVVGGLAFASVAAPHGNSIFAPTCGLTPNGTAYCWGSNEEGALGTTAPLATCGQITCTGTPVLVNTTARFKVLTVGISTVCGITTTREIMCWGGNTYGQVGDGTDVNRPFPVLVAGGLIWP